MQLTLWGSGVQRARSEENFKTPRTSSHTHLFCPLSNIFSFSNSLISLFPKDDEVKYTLAKWTSLLNVCLRNQRLLAVWGRPWLHRGMKDIFLHKISETHREQTKGIPILGLTGRGFLSSTFMGRKKQRSFSEQKKRESEELGLKKQF